MKQVSRLSRVEFIAAGSALLASCSGGGTVARMSPPTALPGGSAPSMSSRRIAALRGNVSPLGHVGYQLSSSSSGHALAVHSASGDFLASFAMGSAFTRSTSADGSQLVMSASLPRRPGWYRATNGGKFKLGQMKSGAPAVLAMNASGARRLMYSTRDGYAHVVDDHGNAAVGETRAHAVGASAGLAGLIDNPKTWAVDDDFAGRVADYSPSVGLAQVASQSGSRQSLYVNQNSGGDSGDTGDCGDVCGDFGDGYMGDLGDLSSADDSDVGQIAFTKGQCDALDFYGSAIGAAGLVLLFLPGMQVAAAAAGAVGGVAAILQHFGCGVTAGGSWA